MPRRKHLRLKGYDYSRAGSYFVTFCAKDMCKLLGRVVLVDNALGALNHNTLIGDTTSITHPDPSNYVVGDALGALNHNTLIGHTTSITHPNPSNCVVGDALGAPTHNTLIDNTTPTIHPNASNYVGCDALGAPTHNTLIGHTTPTIQLSEYGKIVHNEIEQSAIYYDNIKIDKFVIMPNHIHMIVSIYDFKDTPTSLSNLISIIKRKTNAIYGFSMWQKSYHDRIIRNNLEYQKISRYIDENPLKWTDDCYYSR